MTAKASPPVPPPSVGELLCTLDADHAQRAQVGALAERLYGHVFRAVNRSALYSLEQLLWSELDRLKLADDFGELATALLSEALFRVGHDPARCVEFVPDGISDAEQIAASYDDTCLMCTHELAEAQRREAIERGHAPAVDDPEWDDLQARAACAWRAEHSAALRRHGFGPPATGSRPVQGGEAERKPARRS